MKVFENIQGLSFLEFSTQKVKIEQCLFVDDMNDIHIMATNKNEIQGQATCLINFFGLIF